MDISPLIVYNGHIMYDYNEITVRKFIVFEGEPYEVMSSHIFRKQMRKPVNDTKLKNLLNGRIVEHSFGATDKVHTAEIDSKKIKFLYANKGEWWFCEENNPAARFKISDSVLGNSGKFLKPNSIVEASLFDEQIFRIDLPIKIELMVKEAPPVLRGDSSKSGNKLVVLETGAGLNVPMFVVEGDIVRINTETGEYVERVK
jgi:elongation factor P